MEVGFRITYERFSDHHNDTLQMAKGGLLVRVNDVAGLDHDTPATLELVLPDGARFESAVRVIQILTGFGVAVTIDPVLAGELRNAVTAGRERGAGGPARHERVRPPASTPSAPAVPQTDKLTHAAKIQLALHGKHEQHNTNQHKTNQTHQPNEHKNPQNTNKDVLA